MRAVLRPGKEALLPVLGGAQVRGGELARIMMLQRRSGIPSRADGSARGREPEREFALFGPSREVLVLPGVVVLESGPCGSGAASRAGRGRLPLLGLSLMVTPAVLVVHAHDVYGVRLSQLRLAVDDHKVVVVFAGRLRAHVVRACHDARFWAKRVDDYALAVDHDHRVVEFFQPKGLISIDGRRQHDIDVCFGELAAVKQSNDWMSNGARILVDDAVDMQLGVIGGRGRRRPLDDVVQQGADRARIEHQEENALRRFVDPLPGGLEIDSAANRREPYLSCRCLIERCLPDHVVCDEQAVWVVVPALTS